MTDRYFAKVVSVVDPFTIVINAGSDRVVKLGDVFMVVGIGPMIEDPDTRKEIERLEIVRGRARVSHLQPKMATLTSMEVEHLPDVREVKKVKGHTGRRAPGLLATIYGPDLAEDSITETITPGADKRKALVNVTIGDVVIKM